MPKYFFIVFYLIILAGCKKQNEIKTEESVTTKTDSSNNLNKTDIYEGVYLSNKSTKLFIDCSNPDSTYWVIDDTKMLEERYNKMFEVPNVYNSVIAKIKGKIEVTEDPSTAENYPTTLRVKEVISVEKKNFSNTCVPFDFWALGNEPGWSLQISNKENLIEFSLPGESKSYYFFYSEPIQENGYTVYRNHNQIQRYLIEIKIRKETCSDTMSGKVYEYSVEVELSDKRKFKGCGIKGKI